MLQVEKYGFNEDIQQIYDAVFKISREELYPLAERMDIEDWFPEEKMRSLKEYGLAGVCSGIVNLAT